MAKIYTSRFSNPELQTGNYTVVGIVRGLPRFKLKYELAGNIRQIAPPSYLWNENNREIFTPKYFEHMEQQSIGIVQNRLDEYLSKGKDVVLCCYEDVRIPGEWCHRLVFAEWYEEKSGIKIAELSDSSVIKYPKGYKPIEAPESEEQQQPEYKQMSLFG